MLSARILASLFTELGTYAITSRTTQYEFQKVLPDLVYKLSTATCASHNVDLLRKNEGAVIDFIRSLSGNERQPALDSLSAMAQSVWRIKNHAFDDVSPNWGGEHTLYQGLHDGYNAIIEIIGKFRS